VNRFLRMVISELCVDHILLNNLKKELDKFVLLLVHSACQYFSGLGIIVLMLLEYFATTAEQAQRVPQSCAAPDAPWRPSVASRITSSPTPAPKCSVPSCSVASSSLFGIFPEVHRWRRRASALSSVTGIDDDFLPFPFLSFFSFFCVCQRSRRAKRKPTL